MARILIRRRQVGAGCGVGSRPEGSGPEHALALLSRPAGVNTFDWILASCNEVREKFRMIEVTTGQVKSLGRRF